MTTGDEIKVEAAELAGVASGVIPSEALDIMRT
jgi:hypothetical protein